jgi:hypothetical protein
VQKPGLDSRHLNTGHRMASKQNFFHALPRSVGRSGFDVVLELSMRQQWFAFARLANPHMT